MITWQATTQYSANRYIDATLGNNFRNVISPGIAGTIYVSAAYVGRWASLDWILCCELSHHVFGVIANPTVARIKEALWYAGKVPCRSYRVSVGVQLIII